jgi:hypothetical protein
MLQPLTAIIDIRLVRHSTSPLVPKTAAFKPQLLAASGRRHRTSTSVANGGEYLIRPAPFEHTIS